MACTQTVNTHTSEAGTSAGILSVSEKRWKNRFRLLCFWHNEANFWKDKAQLSNNPELLLKVTQLQTVSNIDIVLFKTAEITIYYYSSESETVWVGQWLLCFHVRDTAFRFSAHAEQESPSRSVRDMLRGCLELKTATAALRKGKWMRRKLLTLTGAGEKANVQWGKQKIL